MATPSLRKVSGRIPPKPTPPASHEMGAVGAARTESVHSDTPNVSSSGDFSSILRVQLKTAFPSIYTSMNLMKRHHDAKNIHALRTIALVFLTTYRTIIAETAKFCTLDSTDIELHICRASTISIGKLFENHVNNLEELSRIDPQAFNSAFRFAQMALTTLEHLHQLTVLTSREKKALPSIPDEEEGDNLDASSVYHDAVSDIQSTSAAMPPPSVAPPPSIIGSASLGSNSSGTKVDSVATSSTLQEYSPMPSATRELEEETDCIKSLPSKVGLTNLFKQKKASLFNQKNKVTAAEPQQQQQNIPSYMTEDEAHVEDDFVFARRSTIYFPNDPRLEKSKLPLIRPTSMAGSIRFDSRGRIKAGTLEGLIRVLSSSEGIVNADLLNTMMSNFRVFSSPQGFFSQLVARYDERPPHAFDPTQAQRWELEFRAVRVRVVKIILFWLKEHWDRGSDIGILPEIKAFIEHRTQNIVSDNLLSLLHEQVAVIEKGITPANKPIPPKKVEAHPPAKFKFPVNKQTCNLSLQLLAYNSSHGRSELARQITAKISEMYICVEPSTMVKYWGLKPEQKHALERQDNLDPALRLVLKIRDFEEALVMWVSYTILKHYDRQQRVDFITFWIDIALQCLELRNFSSACCIFTGVAHNSITSMKATILHVPRRVKARFYKLEQFFTGHGNYGPARSAMDGSGTATQPMVPLSAPLKHDMGVCQEIPKTLNHHKNGEDVELINLQGYEIMSKTIKSLSYRVPYGIQKNQDFHEWLDGQLLRFSNHSEIESMYECLYRRGRKREPRDETLRRFNDPWLYVVEGGEYVGPIDPTALAASATSSTGKAKSILQSLRSRTHNKK